METRFLQTFVMVVETTSIAETARRLNLTPSAVAQRLRALEAEVGISLIHRSGQAMHPTDAGAAILRASRSLVAAAEDLRDAASAADQTDIGNLRIGVINSMVTGLLPDILAILTATRPRLRIYVRPGSSSELHRLVTEGELDAAIVVRPHFPLPKSMMWHALHDDPLVLITAREMATASPAALLRREPFIRYDRNHWGGRIVDLYLRKIRIAPRETYELDSLEAIAVLVDRGLGISVIPDWLPPWPQDLDLRKTPLAGAPLRQVGVVALKTSPRIRLVSAFSEDAARVAEAKRRRSAAHGGGRPPA